jgi:hypothetical protein
MVLGPCRFVYKAYAGLCGGFKLSILSQGDAGLSFWCLCPHGPGPILREKSVSKDLPILVHAQGVLIVFLGRALRLRAKQFSSFKWQA